MDRYEHIIIPEQIRTSIKFSPKTKGGGDKLIPNRNRAEHAARLQKLFAVAHEENERIKNEMRAVALPARTGTYLEFSGASDYELVTKSLEDQKAGIRLLNIKTVENTEDNTRQTFATVYIPHGQERKFLNKLNIALLRAFWTDNFNEFPSTKLDWYEVWIRTNNADTIDKQHDRFAKTLKILQIPYKKDSILTFPERSVFLVNANIASFKGVKTNRPKRKNAKSAKTAI